MKMYIIDEEKKFKEFKETNFEETYKEATLENWLENNPESILEGESLFVIGKQVTTNLGSFIDLLALDRQGALVVIELKRNRTPRETIAQALEYASFVESLNLNTIETIFQAFMDDESADLAQEHKDFFNLSDEAVSINHDQRIVIFGQQISPAIIQTANYLRKKGIRTTCVEFSFFETAENINLFSVDIISGYESPMNIAITSTPLDKIDRDEFMRSLNEYGTSFFIRFFDWAKRSSYHIRWGTKGFSLNIVLNGIMIPLGCGYIPDSKYRQSIITWFSKRKIGMFVKSNLSADDFTDLIEEAESFSFFQKYGQREFMWMIDREYSDDEIQQGFSWFDRIANRVKQLCHNRSND